MTTTTSGAVRAAAIVERSAMSIAAISSAFAPLMHAGSSVEPVAAVAAVPRSAPVASHAGGRRRELIDTTAHALGMTASLDNHAEQAVFRFAHALMHDLRAVAGDRSDPGSAPDVGHSAWSDLPQRLSALATAASQPSIAASELPDTPNPLTPATAALHIMKVPTSRLLEAFVSLQRAVGQQVEAVTPAQTRSALAEMVQRLAAVASPSSGGAIEAGAVLDLRA
jgi:hypothetical protein